MSAEKITTTHYQCRCDLADCPGKGKVWISKDDAIPERCNWCGRRTWNGTDKRPHRTITANNKTMRVSEWAKETGLARQIISYRLNKGWTDEEAVLTPAGQERHHATCP